MKHETYDHIENPLLRCWNRCQMGYNISEKFGEDEALAYLNSFDDEDTARIMLISTCLATDGYDEVHRTITQMVGESNV